MHDGVAEDLASFGYLVDDVTATAESEAQVLRLRERTSSVVAEVAASVLTLRVGAWTAASSLGPP